MCCVLCCVLECALVFYVVFCVELISAVCAVCVVMHLYVTQEGEDSPAVLSSYLLYCLLWVLSPTQTWLEFQMRVAQSGAVCG